MERTVILIPVLGRPARVAQLVASIKAATPEPHRVLFIADPDDTPTLEAIAAAGAEVITPGGSYARKINAGIAATSEPLIFLAADDLTFHPGWLTAAAAKLTDRIGVVGTNDLANPRVISGQHATHSLVARWYADLGHHDGPGLLHEGYRHNFVDDELVATARARGAWAVAADAHVEHHHPCWGTAEVDATYERGRQHFRLDRRLWLHRSRLIAAATPAPSAAPPPADFDVTVLVCTFGDQEWQDLAQERAVPSAERLGCRVIHAHADTLHQARNLALDQARSEWVIYLDADDELDAGYLHAMAAGTGDVRAPSVTYVMGQRVRPTHIPRVSGHDHACTADCLPDGNWIIVGAAARTELLRRVGGWHDFPVYEDWDLWLRCYLAGADIQPCPSAGYRAHVRRGSRNRAPSMDVKNEVHRQIVAANLPDRAAA